MKEEIRGRSDVLTFDPNCSLFHCTAKGILHHTLVHATVITADIVQLKTSRQLDVRGPDNIQVLHQLRDGIDPAPNRVGVWESADLAL